MHYGDDRNGPEIFYSSSLGRLGDECDRSFHGLVQFTHLQLVLGESSHKILLLRQTFANKL